MKNLIIDEKEQRTYLIKVLEEQKIHNKTESEQTEYLINILKETKKQ